MTNRPALTRADVEARMAAIDRCEEARQAASARRHEERRAAIARREDERRTAVARREEERLAAISRRVQERATRRARPSTPAPMRARPDHVELAAMAAMAVGFDCPGAPEETTEEDLLEGFMYLKLLDLFLEGMSWARIAAQLTVQGFAQQPSHARWTAAAAAKVVREFKGPDTLSPYTRRVRRRDREAERIPGTRRRAIRESTRARQKLAERERPRAAAAPPPWSPVPREDLPGEFKDYLRWRAASKSESTASWDARGICSLAGFVGLEDFWQRLDGPTLGAYQRDLARRVPHPSTRSGYLSALRVFLRHASAEGWSSRDLSRRIALPRVTLGEPRPIPGHLVPGILAALPTETRRDAMVRALVYVLFSTGCRITEVLSIDRADVQPHGQIRVRGVKSSTGMRTVVLLPEAQQAIADYLARRSEDRCPALFVSYLDHPGARRRLSPDGARTYLHELRRQLLHVPGMAALTGPHVARHTLATMLLEVTQDVRLVQEVLGHRSLQSLRVYTEITDHRKREVFAAGGAFAHLLHGVASAP